MKAAAIAAALLVLGSALLITFTAALSPPGPNFDPARREARRKVEDLVAQQTLYWNAKVQKAEWDLILARDGPKVQGEYIHCTTGVAPRKRHSRQRCAKLIVRIKQEDAANEAALEAQQKNW